MNADLPQRVHERTHEPAHVQYDAPVRSFTAEQTKEAFDIARNSIELLSTVLSSSPQHDDLQVNRHRIIRLSLPRILI